MNLLANATSPYLRSAAHQPVFWYPWSKEAFAVAERDNRPILLDIGAVWCHWCHVMDGESYEDPALAAFLNQNFICLKVDRDERPDVDARYQRAIQIFTGQGGWPLTAFLTPGGEAFYGGTYFPPEGKFGRPGFRSVLEQVLRIYREQGDRVTDQVEALRRVVAESLDESSPGEPSEDLLSQAVASMARLFDARNGGFGSAPKFPHSAAIELLLHRWRDRPEPIVREMIEKKLLAMARGGIHDHLGGGFHRYSTDAQWIVPHFEKMSYDNSELLRAYLDAWSVFGHPEFRDSGRGIVRWVREVLADEAGGYAASQDADVGLHDDGDYFTWTLEEAAEILSGIELDIAAAYYDIGTAGEMHHNPGKNVLFAAAPVEEIARRSGRSIGETQNVLVAAEAKLLAARTRREAPFVDRTRYTGWNAMMASAILRAGYVLDDSWAESHALQTLRRIRDEGIDRDAVAHSPGGVSGLLDDQVQVAGASLDAYEATGDTGWLGWSEAIMDRVWRDYWDEERGGFRDIASGSPADGLLPMASKPIQDAPTPSANSVAGLVLSRLKELTGDDRWTLRRDALIRTFAGSALGLGLHGATFLLAVSWQLSPATHVVVVGARDDPEAERMHRRALATFLPRRVVHRVTGAESSSWLPGPVAAMMSGEGARAFLCVGASCRLPASNDAEWKERLQSAEAPNSDETGHSVS